MTRRADRRRDDLQRALLPGPAPLRSLARALRRPRLLVYADLCAMEEAGTVVTTWIPRPGWPDGAGLYAYRLLTIAEQDTRGAEKAAFEQRLQAALHAAANHNTTPGEAP